MKKVTSRWRFSSPRKSDVLIVDSARSEWLKLIVFPDLDTETIEVRPAIFHISLYMLVQFLSSLPFLNIKACLTFGGFKNELLAIYYVALVRATKAKVVITFIDNSLVFQDLCRRYKTPQYIAVQNGFRGAQYEKKTPLSIQHLFCLGNYDREMVDNLGYEVESIQPLGSLLGGYTWSERGFGELEERYDVCFISMWRPHIMLGNAQADFREAHVVLDKYFSRYVKDSSIRACIALFARPDTGKEQEIEYYEGLFGRDRVDFIDRNVAEFSSYRAMAQSMLTLNYMSTAGLEALGWGKKVLFCNFSDSNRWDLPDQGVCTLKEKSYESFKKRLDYLISMPKDEYLSASQIFRDRYMSYPSDFRPSRIVREKIDSFL